MQTSTKHMVRRRRPIYQSLSLVNNAVRILALADKKTITIFIIQIQKFYLSVPRIQFVFGFQVRRLAGLKGCGSGKGKLRFVESLQIPRQGRPHPESS